MKKKSPYFSKKLFMRIFATGLALCMLFSVMPKLVSVRAAEGTEGTNLALAATVNSNVVDLSNNSKNGLHDGNKAAGLWRNSTTDVYPVKDYYELAWSEAVSVNQVALSAKDKSTAPVSWHVEVSTDGTAWSNVAGITDVTWATDNSTAETKTMTFATRENIKALRVYIDAVKFSIYGYGFTEIEVYNVSDAVVNTTPVVSNNLGESATISASSNLTENGKKTLPMLKDGSSLTSFFRAGLTATAQDVTGTVEDYYQFTWENPVSVNQVDMAVVNAGIQAPTSWHVEVSTDGTTGWTKVASIADVNWEGGFNDIQTKKLTFDLQENIKGLRVCIDKAYLLNNGYGIVDLEVYNIANLALSATISTENKMTETAKNNLSRLNDGSYVHEEGLYRSYASGTNLGITIDDVKEKDFYQYTWSNPISVNQVRMVVREAQNCAPTAWHIQVSEDGKTGWRDVSYTSAINWWYKNSTMEQRDLTFALQKDIKGLRVYIDNWNTVWGEQYAIWEIEVYNDPSAEVSKMAVENLALSATISASDDVPSAMKEKLSVFKDGNLSNSVFRSGLTETANGQTGPVADYYQFTWETSVSVNQIEMTVVQAGCQAPTAWHVEVSTDGTTDWRKVASISDVNWPGKFNDTQTKQLNFALQNNIKGLRVYIDEAYLEWGGYAINEIEICNAPVSMSGYTSTLDGTIDMNFFLNLNLTEEEKTSAATYMSFMVPGEEEQRVAFSEVTTSGYKFTCKVPAKRMTDTITAKFYVKGRLYPETYEYSVEAYAKTIANAPTDKYSEQARALAKAMLHYGAYSQVYFGYNTNDLANADLEALDLSSVTYESFQELVNNNVTNLTGLGTNKGSSLILESETTLKLYFKPADGVSPKNLTFTYDGKVLEASEYISNGETWICIQVANIAAHELGDTIEIPVSNGTTSGTLKYSALTYGYNVLKNEKYNDRADLQNLVKALFLYRQAAVNYSSVQKAGYVLDWSDEFNGTTLSSQSWLTEHLSHRSSSATAPKANATVADGVLTLRIDKNTKDFYTGNANGFKISSIQTYEKNGLHNIAHTSDSTLAAPFEGYTTQYGYFEMRCKIPACGGGGASHGG